MRSRWLQTRFEWRQKRLVAAELAVSGQKVHLASADFVGQMLWLGVAKIQKGHLIIGHQLLGKGLCHRYHLRRCSHLSRLRILGSMTAADS